MSVIAGIVACLVVGVADGDTINVRCGQEPMARVRLAEIDAPESHQAYGTKAKQRLAELVFRQTISLQVVDRDRYGRLVGTIYLNQTNINALLVREGLAWCYTPYVRGKWCKPLQDQARLERRNLWSDQMPIPPWEFRKKGD